MINLEKESKTPIYQQIYRSIKESVLSGELPDGERLASTRQLARELGVGRNTVEAAYEQLLAEGYISSRPRSGYAVERLELCLHPGCTERIAKDDPPLKKSAASQPEKYRFQYGESDKRLFPAKKWRAYVSEAMDELPYRQEELDVQGDIQLREELQKYLYQHRGVRCTAEQIVICGGFQSAMEIIIRLLQGCKSVAVENPGYSGALSVLLNLGLTAEPIPVTPEGIDLKKLADASSPLVLVAPSHQFPLGSVMPISRRRELIYMAGAKNMTIIEDDYDSEFRYRGSPIPSLQSIDDSGRVVYVGTFSKVLYSGIRTAYFVLPWRLLGAYRERYRDYQCVVPVIDQKVLHRFMRSGDWERQIRRTCLIYKKKHDLVMEALQKSMGRRVTIHGAQAGLHVVLELTDGRSEAELVERAREKGVYISGISGFWIGERAGCGEYLILGYGGIPEGDIVNAVQLLREAWFDEDERP